MSSEMRPRAKTEGGRVDERRDLVAQSRELVIRSHERAQQAVDRAVRVREALRSDLGRIFDPFTRGDPGHEGLGIGLALVRGIVELHRGSTEASSPGPGGGSTFKVTLPRCPHPLVRAGAPQTAEK